MDKLIRVDVDSQLSVLVPLAEQARNYARRRNAERTLEAYTKHWRHFENWCEAHGLCALPCTADTLVWYITARANDKKKVATIHAALTAINQRHKRAGLGSPRSHEYVRATLEGIERTHGIAPERKTPVLENMLSAMVEVLPDTLSGARDRALLLVGFTGAFRRSELVSLDVEDIVDAPGEGLRVRLRRSKTDQKQLGRTLGLPYSSAAAVCPVRSMQAWLERSAIADGPAFRSVDRHGNLGARLGAQDVARIVKRTATAAGFKNVQDLSGHSLRAGLATAAAKAKKSAPTIMKQTGHKSVAMVTGYIRDAELFTDNAAAGLL